VSDWIREIKKRYANVGADMAVIIPNIPKGMDCFVREEGRLDLFLLRR
jgi:hypothetical protein